MGSSGPKFARLYGLALEWPLKAFTTAHLKWHVPQSQWPQPEARDNDARRCHEDLGLPEVPFPE